MSPRALHPCKGSPKCIYPATPRPPRRSGQAEPAVNHPCPKYIPGPLTTCSFLKCPSGGCSEPTWHCPRIHHPALLPRGQEREEPCVTAQRVYSEREGKRKMQEK